MEHFVAAASAAISGKLRTPTLLTAGHLRHLLRRSLLLLLHTLLGLLLSILALFHCLHSPKSPISTPSSPSTCPSPAARALSHVLAVVSRVSVSSRKYDLVRSLADRLLDDNLRFIGGAEINHAALSVAFSHALRRLESSISPKPDGSLLDSLRSGLRIWSEKEGSSVAACAEAEKTAAEIMWMAGKMAECGAAAEAVVRWGAAAGLAGLALDSEPRLQVALVRVSAFLFKHVNARMPKGVGEDEEEWSIAQRRMAMLTSWLPLFCRATNGTDTPILTSSERSETVRVLQETIEKLNWNQQEEVLALWLHHFTTSPDSDWPNLESCYTRWYAESRKLLLE
ncbi:hypothetical protein J5N97_006768 [Dioscorea zingiberensis]|uniref:Uncharacterized protein n=1 Tax=Dioscorea zingiberensis TaxID=325984 RepID=A0A9D5HUB7_9LILI|nr:hypothetical protein J5N97_006768 [Dioscorea zingiberensis]